MEITPSKIIALIIAAAYFAIAITASRWDARVVFALCIVTSLPLALIWFPEPIGSMTGPVFRGGWIDNESPPFPISFMGWLFLLGLPVIAYLLG